MEDIRKTLENMSEEQKSKAKEIAEELKEISGGIPTTELLILMCAMFAKDVDIESIKERMKNNEPR